MLKETRYSGDEVSLVANFARALPPMATHSWDAIVEQMRASDSAVHGMILDPVLERFHRSFVSSGPISLGRLTGHDPRFADIVHHGYPVVKGAPFDASFDVGLFSMALNIKALLTDWDFSSTSWTNPRFNAYKRHENVGDHLTFAGSVFTGTSALRDLFEGVEGYLPPPQPLTRHISFLGSLSAPRDCDPHPSQFVANAYAADFPTALRGSMRYSEPLWMTSTWATMECTDYAVYGDVVYDTKDIRRSVTLEYSGTTHYHHWTNVRRRVHQKVILRIDPMPTLRFKAEDDGGVDYTPPLTGFPPSGFSIILSDCLPYFRPVIMVVTTSIERWVEEKQAWHEDWDVRDLIGTKVAIPEHHKVDTFFRRIPQPGIEVFSETVDSNASFDDARSTPFTTKTAPKKKIGNRHLLTSSWFAHTGRLTSDIRGANFHSAALALQNAQESLDMNNIENLSQLGSMRALLDPISLTMVFLRNVWTGKPYDAAVSLIDVLANAKLVYDFGLSPSYSDAKEFAENAGPILESLSHSLFNKDITGRGSFNIPQGELNRFYADLELQVVVKTKATYRMGNSALLGALLPAKAFGILPSLSFMWNLRSYSFVVDWFTATDDKLSDVDAALQALILTHVGYTHTWEISSPLTEQFLYDFGITEMDRPRVVHYLRAVEPVYPSPYPSRLDFQPPSGVPSTGLGLAFVWSQLGH